MNVCELNKFIDMANHMDRYNFNPTTEEATISKSDNSIVIDLNLPVDDQISLFEDFLLSLFAEGLNNG